MLVGLNIQEITDVLLVLISDGSRSRLDGLDCLNLLNQLQFMLLLLRSCFVKHKFSPCELIGPLSVKLTKGHFGEIFLPLQFINGFVIYLLSRIDDVWLLNLVLHYWFWCLFLRLINDLLGLIFNRYFWILFHFRLFFFSEQT